MQGNCSCDTRKSLYQSLAQPQFEYISKHSSHNLIYHSIAIKMKCLIQSLVAALHRVARLWALGVGRWAVRRQVPGLRVQSPEGRAGSGHLCLRTISPQVISLQGASHMTLYDISSSLTTPDVGGGRANRIETIDCMILKIHINHASADHTTCQVGLKFHPFP